MRANRFFRFLLKGALSAVALAALLIMAPPAAQGGIGKVTICHVPPGNPANAHTITVGIPAIPAHLAHGDSLGACGEEPPGNGGPPGATSRLTR